MSIREEAYALCKAVKSSPSRQKIRNVIHSLNFLTQGSADPEGDRTHFGYIARRLHAQVLGYLVVDERRDLLNEGPFPQHIMPLKDWERQLLIGAHSQIKRLNDECVAPLTLVLPSCGRAVDPYSRFGFVVLENVTSEDLIPRHIIDVMARSFHQHPAIAKALEIAPETNASMTEEKYVSAVMGIANLLFQSGVHTAPADLANIPFMHSMDSQYRRVTRHIAALVCIRDSLAVLDQLVFQAILGDRLSPLDDNNIIHIGPQTSHLAGCGLSVKYQPNSLGILEDGELVIVNCSRFRAASKQLWRVEAVSYESSEESGCSVEVQLREVGEDLNAFAPLLQNM